MVKHPADWCAKRCGIPLDPVLISEGLTMHPTCEFPPRSNGCAIDCGGNKSGAGSTAQTADFPRRLTDLLGDPLMNHSMAPVSDDDAQVAQVTPGMVDD